MEKPIIHPLVIWLMWQHFWPYLTNGSISIILTNATSIIEAAAIIDLIVQKAFCCLYIQIIKPKLSRPHWWITIKLALLIHRSLQNISRVKHSYMYSVINLKFLFSVTLGRQFNQNILYTQKIRKGKEKNEFIEFSNIIHLSDVVVIILVNKIDHLKSLFYATSYDWACHIAWDDIWIIEEIINTVLNTSLDYLTYFKVISSGMVEKTGVPLDKHSSLAREKTIFLTLGVGFDLSEKHCGL